MQHFFTYPTVTPLPRRGLPTPAQELDAQLGPRHNRPRPASDEPIAGGAEPRVYSSASSGGSDSTAS